LYAQVIVRERRGAHPRLVAYKLREARVWDEEWSRYSPDAVRAAMESYRRFPVIYPALVRHLPRDGAIVEAGSGLGHWVALLREAGFDAFGVDASREALVRSRQVFPGLRFDEADVLNLPFADGALAGYVSFGVAEHFEDGPQALLREAARVLRDGGVMVISVPWLSPLRRLQRRRPPGPPQGAVFYQYFFTRAEIVAAVEGAGFELIAVDGYGTLKTLRDEWRELRPRQLPPVAASAAATPAAAPASARSKGALRGVGRAVYHVLLENRLAHRLAAHMLLIVARRRPRGAAAARA
jgi:SAM-dependent methyltransferase